MDKNFVIKMLTTAFTRVSRPTHVKLFMMGWDSYEELNHAYEHLIVDDWALLTFEIIRKHRDALGGLSPDWRAFLIPAFLIKVLENLDEADVLIDNTLLYLTHPILRFEFDTEDEKDFADFVGFLSSEQCAALSEYLQFFVSMNPEMAVYNHDNIIQAIQYWDRKAGRLYME